MPRDNELISKRNADIRRDFQALTGSTTQFPVRWSGQSTKVTLNAAQVMLLLRNKYHLATRTLEDIIYPPSSGGKPTGAQATYRPITPGL